MANVQVKIENLGALQAAFRKAPGVTEKHLQKAIEASGAELQKNARRGVVPWKTGNLVQSFGTGLVLGRLFARVFPTANYAIFVHEGTRAHVIRPVNKKALFWPGAAHPVKSVNHPGTKPNRFMLKIAEKANDAIQSHFVKAVANALKEIAR